MSQPETRLQRRIQRALREQFRGAFIRKIHVSEYQSTGLPDLLVIVHGYAILLEVKRPKKHPSAIQLNVMSKIRASGGASCVVRSPQEAVDVVRYVLRIRGLMTRSQVAWIRRIV